MNGKWRQFKGDINTCLKQYNDCLKGCPPPCPSIQSSTGPEAKPGPAVRSASPDTILAELLDTLKQIGTAVDPYIADDTPYPAAVEQQVLSLLDNLVLFGGPDYPEIIREYALSFDEADTVQQSFDYYGFDNSPPYPVYYAAEIQRPNGTFFLRGKTQAF